MAAGPALSIVCTVRGCGRPLEREGQMWRCAARHAFDIARSGYVNLLQPQDRRSPEAGDSEDAIAARARLFDAGVGRSLLSTCVSLASRFPGSPKAVVDLGCGSGEQLAGLCQQAGAYGAGVDLSVHAIDRAARRFPSLQWLVANVDRSVPIASHHVDLAISLHARRNPLECARVLKAAGHLIVAIPAPDDLIELREAVEGSGAVRDRADTLMAEHRERFDLLDRQTVRERHGLDRPALLDLLRGTYRGARHAAAEAVARLDRLDVTAASEVFIFTVRAGRSAAESAW
jgi:23S rRNA (guanine745-N1)-methyltransferase